jgi:gas vesicle protein
MALFDDFFKGNLLTSLAVGVGAVLLAPVAGQVLRPVAKAAIKGAILAYQGLAQLGEMTSDIVAEARQEFSKETDEHALDSPTQTPSRSREKRDKPE